MIDTRHCRAYDWEALRKATDRSYAIRKRHDDKVRALQREMLEKFGPVDLELQKKFKPITSV